MQVLPQPPLLPSPPKPDCLVWYAGDSCDVLIQQYDQAMQQRQQQEWQVQVTGTLQKQIADQRKQLADQQTQIKALQLKIESQTMEALQNEARNQAFMDGIGVVVGTGLAFLVAVAGFRRLVRNSTDLKQGEERPASA
jgi:hypothetical protein